ncbi:hypothetical protein Goklo_008495, partial [Gossypium klotzschianum]|nr:hypothetical protein [Gossypium klotzschianum]
DFTCISVTQNNLQVLKEVRDQWDDETKQLFYCEYGDLPYLLNVKVDKYLFRALTQYWNSAYSYFTFGKVDLVPTIEEFTTLLRCPMMQTDKAYSKAINVSTFLKRLMSITGMSEQWVAAQIKQKGDSKCILWKSLRDLILAHLDTRKRVDVFALSIYGLVIFSKELGHIDDAISDLFDWLEKMNIEKVSYRVFSEDYSPLKEFSLQDEDVEWRAHWMILNEILYKYGDFDWVPLLEIWGAVGYSPLLVLRQYRSMQFISVPQGLAQCEFAYKCDNYKKKVRLRARVAELEKSLHQYRSRNSVIQLKVSLTKIEKLKGNKEKLEAAP